MPHKFVFINCLLMNCIACGGNFFTLEGFIESPRFPNNYPKLKDCVWVINLPITNQIELNITEFQLEESKTCHFDFLEIRLVKFMLGMYY